MNLLGVPSEGFEDEPVDAHAGDVFLALYPSHRAGSGQADLYRRWRTLGVRTAFIIDDQPPARVPRQVSHDGEKPCTDWLEIVAEADNALCVSRSVADDFRAWLDEQGARRSMPIEIGCIHRGGDVKNTAPSRDMPAARIAATCTLTLTESVDMLVQALGLPPRQSALPGGTATV